MSRRPRSKGFTLLELMIVVAIIGILLAIALPAYRDSIRKSRRAVAQTCLTEASQFMERFYTTNLRYDEDRAGDAVPDPGVCTQDIADFYEITFEEDPTATTYALQAEPIGDQADDVCGTLTLNDRGTKGISGTGDDCWR